MFSVTRFFQVPSQSTLLRLSCLALAASLAACSTIENFISPDKVDYRTAARQTGGLDVPPDLTQLARDNRAQVQDGAISASAMQQQQASAATSPKPATGATPVPAAAMVPVAISSVGELRIERSGTTRWLHSNLTPEQLWPQVREFWLERGFTLAREQADLGIIETDWYENRAKLKQDIIRSTIGKLFDGLYSTGERDSYRTRLERVAGGTEIYISQKGMKEVYTSDTQERTAWQPRPNEPELEAEFLSRLLLKLGGKTEQASSSTPAASAVAAAQAAPSVLPSSALPNGNARNRPLSEVPDSLKVNEGFERAWRRVGQSLDRHGFTIEDRDRSQGLFFLRYADPTQAGKEEPNFFMRLFSSDTAPSTRYRVSVKSSGETSTVSVLDDKGMQQTSDIAKRILNLLMDDLR